MKKPPTMEAIDPKCLELADHFLQDRIAAYPLVRTELANAIQDAVDNFLCALDS